MSARWALQRKENISLPASVTRARLASQSSVAETKMRFQTLPHATVLLSATAGAEAAATAAAAAAAAAAACCCCCDCGCDCEGALDPACIFSL